LRTGFFRQMRNTSDEEKNKDGYYRLLARMINLIVIVVSVTPMLLVSGILLYQFQNSYHEKIYAYLGQLVQNHKQSIDNYLKERLGNIRFLTSIFSFEELSNEGFLQDRLYNLQKDFGPVFVDLGVVNERGVQMAYAGPFKLGGASYGDAEWFKKALEKDYFISDVFLGLRGLPHFIVTVRDNWNGENWILRATIDFVAFSNLVSGVRVGQTGFAFIVNREEEFQTKPLREPAITKTLYSELIAQGYRSGDEVRVMERRNESGKKVIYAASFLKGGEWLLIFQQDASDAFADLNRAIRTTILIIVLGGLAILTMAFFLSRRVVRRIAQTDQEKQRMDEQIVETGKLASIGELAAGIAHEINNPVAIMVEEAGWIGDLLEEEDFKEGKNLEEFKRALAQINTQGKRCKEITSKLLTFARKTDSRIRAVRINDLLEEMVALSSQRAKYANVEIQTDFEEDLPTLRVSPSELQQVFLNLINNALDAMEKRGGLLKIRSRLNGGEMIVEVTDNGPGIPKANLNRIFDPFFTTKPVGKGTGLGLSICYGIVEKMGGRIEVQSVVDVETTFRVRIPSQATEKHQSDRDKSGPGPGDPQTGGREA
jgi:two-component system NtrC family sensor kinase